tara:strand:+ start:1265 stop:1477 length:213 start_codon:yes stop_codon:yes gene_type:complete
MAISTYVGDYFNVVVTVDVKDKQGNHILTFSKSLDEDTESSKVIHSEEADLIGHIHTHFQKLKLGEPKNV